MSTFSIVWAWPQVVTVCIYVANTLTAVALHGVPRTGNHHVATTIIGTALSALILAAGGFWCNGQCQ